MGDWEKLVEKTRSRLISLIWHEHIQDYDDYFQARFALLCDVIREEGPLIVIGLAEDPIKEIQYVLSGSRDRETLEHEFDIIAHNVLSDAMDQELGIKNAGDMSKFYCDLKKWATLLGFVAQELLQ